MSEEKSQNELLALRRAKLEELKSRGIAFPNNYRRDSLSHELHASFDSLKPESLTKKNVTVSIAGRIMLQRIMGKASFITLQDGEGKIQAYIKSDNIGKDAYKEFKKWDLGDIVGIKGKLFKTKTNELTVEAININLLTKSLRPLPEKHAGLVDTEQRYRKRYLDLLTNEESLELFKTRSKIISEIRNIFLEEGYLEVETPMMHPIPGGAAAKPFITHHNALDMDWKRDSWLNPPYQNVKQWIQKAYDEHRKWNVSILALLFAKTDTKIWHSCIFGGRAEVLFLQGRVHFYQNGKRSKNPAPYPSAFVFWRAT